MSQKKGKKGKNWVDYKEIKARVSLEMALNHYGVFKAMKKSGANYVGVCPIHKGTNPRQFSINLEKNMWRCFGNCKVGGNVLDFVAQMENVSIREAGLLLKDWFLSEPSDTEKTSQKDKQGRKQKTQSDSDKLVRKEKEEPDEKSAENKNQDQDVEVNPPLKFQLKNLDSEHSFFKKRGILPETVKRFGIGFCSKGIMKDRIAIPIHNESGDLIAYCGRAVKKKQIEEEGKYRLPAGFVKSEAVYNLWRQTKGQENLILVESFLSVWKLSQCGFKAIVALMGSSLSKTQERLIVDLPGPFKKAILLFDNDESGQRCANDCLLRLGRKIFIKAVDISPYARKPHQLTPAQIKKLI